ncbi:MAG: IPT/TIG domain-containing protein [Solirubrobacterales bacterium]
MRTLRTAAVLPILCLAALLVPGNAAAQTITVGSELVAPFTSNATFSGNSVTVANPQPVGPFVRAFSPVDGTVVRWRLGSQAIAPASQEYRLTILRPDGSGGYAAVATSDPEAASATTIRTFTTGLPIREGDLVGLDVQAPALAEAKIETAETAGVHQFFWDPFLRVGDLATFPSTTPAAVEFGFNAEVQPAPEVGFVGPSSGPVGGGTEVTIKGQNFAAVSGVSFGSVAASSFTVLNEGEISAVSPPGVGVGIVDITVTSSAGTSRVGAADRFTYFVPPLPGSGQSSGSPPPTSPPLTCKVPRLTRKTLPVARKALSRNRCHLGAVRGHRRTGKRVTRQSPRPGVTRPAGSAVKVTIR